MNKEEYSLKTICDHCGRFARKKDIKKYFVLSREIFGGEDRSLESGFDNISQALFGVKELLDIKKTQNFELVDIILSNIDNMEAQVIKGSFDFWRNTKYGDFKVVTIVT